MSGGPGRALITGLTGQDGSFLAELLLGFGPTLLLVGLFVLLARRAQAGAGGLGGLGNFGCFGCGILLSEWSLSLWKGFTQPCYGPIGIVPRLAHTSALFGDYDCALAEPIKIESIFW